MLTPYHIHQAPNAVTLARHAPARFDVTAEATLAAAADLLRLSDQVRRLSSSWAFKIMLFLLSGFLWATSAFAAEVIKYGPGIEGRLYKFDFPFDADLPKDRFLKIKIRLPNEPTAFPSDMDDALKFACDYHGKKLRAQAAKLSASDDWRVKVTFDWVAKKTENIVVTKGDNAEFALSNCSKV